MQIQNEYHGYFLKECIKKHEYGSVYRGQASEEVGSDVVIKIFAIQLLSIRERQRFLQETNLLDSLRHPALLPLREAGIDKGQPYLVRAYAPSGSLITQLSQQDNGIFPLATVMTILTRIGAAVTYLHQKQISHGAIKPENILFDEEQQAFLADIHLTSLAFRPVSQQITIVSEEFEQQSLVSLEQDDKKQSIQDDIYAFSTLAYELLTGYQPFASLNEQDAVLPSYWIPSLPKEVDAVFAQALSSHSEKRFSSTTLFVGALQHALRVSLQEDAVTRQLALLPQTSTKQLVLFQPQVKVQQAGVTGFTRQHALQYSFDQWRKLGSFFVSRSSLVRVVAPISRRQLLTKAQNGIFSHKLPFIILAVLLLLFSIFVPAFLFRLSSNSTSISLHKARNSAPIRHPASTAAGHVAITVPSIKHQNPTPTPAPLPTPIPTPTSVPTPIPPPLPVVVNAGFEFPSLNGDFEYAPDNAGWAFSNDCGIAGNGSDLTANISNAPWGVQVAFIQAHGTISQNISFAQGMYRISFMAAQRVDSDSTQSLEVLIDNTVIGTFTPVGRNYLYYTTFSFTVSPGFHTLQFKGLKGGAHNTAFIDSVAVIN